MRYLVIFLVLANLVYFLWHLNFPAQKPAATSPLPLEPGVDRLVLLSERPLAEPIAKPIEVSVDEKAAETIGQQSADVTVHTETQAHTDGTESSSEETQGHDAELESISSEPGLVCHTVGPLVDTADVTSISEKLSQHGFQLNVRGGKVREPRGYWIYMPAMPASEARSIVADLDAQGMKDYFIGKDNHVSLGIFSSEEKAVRRLKRVKELGYEAQLGQRYRNRAVYWLDVEQHKSLLRGSEVLGKLQEQHADIRVQQVECASLDR